MKNKMKNKMTGDSDAKPQRKKALGMSAEQNGTTGDSDAGSDEARGGGDATQIISMVQQQQDEDCPQKLSHEEQQQQQGEPVYSDAQEFCDDLTKKARESDVNLALQPNVTLPEWPHDQNLTDDLKKVWEDAKTNQRNKQTNQGNKHELFQKTLLCENLSDELKNIVSREIFENGKEEMKKCWFEIGNKLEEKDIEKRLENIKNGSSAVSLKVKKMSDLLLTLCGHSQEKIESTKTWQAKEFKRQKIMKITDAVGDLKEENAKFQTQRSTAAEEFCDNVRLLDDDFFSQSAISETTVPEEIESIANVYDKTFENAKGFLLSPKAKEAHGPGLQVNEDLHREKMEKTMKIMNSMLSDEKNESSQKKETSVLGKFFQSAFPCSAFQTMKKFFYLVHEVRKWKACNLSFHGH